MIPSIQVVKKEINDSWSMLLEEIKMLAEKASDRNAALGNGGTNTRKRKKGLMGSFYN